MTRAVESNVTAGHRRAKIVALGSALRFPPTWQPPSSSEWDMRHSALAHGLRGR